MLTGMQLYEAMLDNGHEANTYTCMLLLEACNFKGKGLYDVALVVYAKLAATMPGPVPDVLKAQLLEVRLWPLVMRSCSARCGWLDSLLASASVAVCATVPREGADGVGTKPCYSAPHSAVAAHARCGHGRVPVERNARAGGSWPHNSASKPGRTQLQLQNGLCSQSTP